MANVDSPKILQFLSETIVSPEKYHQQILYSLAKIFGYHTSIIWKTNKNGHLSEPILFNLNEKLIDNYIKYFCKTDMFNPNFNNLNLAKKLNVLSIPDLMSIEEFELTEFYENVLRPYKFFHEIAAYFFSGNTLLGALAILRSPYETGFAANDIATLKEVVKHISKTLATNALLNDTNYQKQIFEAFSMNSPIGLITLDRSLSVHYINPVAREICAELTQKNNKLDSINQFIKLFLMNDFSTWQTGLLKSLLSPSLKRFTLHVIPTVNQTKKQEELYMIHLIPHNLSPQTILLEHHLCNNNLTQKELEIVELVVEGLSNQEIAIKMFISIHTVKTHLQNIFKKTGVTNRTSLCTLFQKT